MSALSDRLAEAAKALLGISAYKPPIPGAFAIDLDDARVQQARAMQGGQLQPMPIAQTRWFQADIETAQRLADVGDLSMVARLCRAMHKDGFIVGLESTRASGLVALPKRWRGPARMIKQLTAENDTRSVFDEMFPPVELAKMAVDGFKIGVSVGELVPVVGRDFPVLVRLDPEFLTYRNNEDRWYFRSIAGLLPITPGDGRWVLHTPGGRLTPWNDGIWPALGRAFISKDHAIFGRGSFSSSLANPARVAYAPLAATEEQRDGFLAALIRWGYKQAFELPPGWEVKLLESNGRGWAVFKEEIEDDNTEIMIAIVGQVVTVTGGSGFANADVHRTVRADLIAKDAAALAHTINTQGIPAFIAARFGVEALDKSPRYEIDTTPPKDLEAEGRALTGVATAITSLRDALAASDMRLDVTELVQRYGVPIAPGKPDVAPPPSEPAAEPAATEETSDETSDSSEETSDVSDQE